VVGQVFQVLLAGGGSGGKPCQRFDEAAMQHLALAQQQLGIDGLLSQRVAKGKLVCPLFYHQLGGHYLFEEGQ
jgi:hypothetical protein